MTAVVTGGGGHIGANLVRELLARGERVRVIEFARSRALEGLPIELVEGDVLHMPSLKEAFADADVVYHLAGVVSVDSDRDGQICRVNIDGAENAARAALAVGVRRLVHFSSCDALDPRPLDQPLDERRPRIAWDDRRHSVYERAKAEGERRVRAVVREGVDAVIVHPSAVIGPHDFGPSYMGRVFLELYHRRLPGLVRGGFDFADARDVAAGAIAAAERGRRNESYLLAGHYLSLHELARLASRFTGVAPPRLTVPLWLARLAAPGWATYKRWRGQKALYTTHSLRIVGRRQRVLADKAERELGYHRRPIDETIFDLHRWFADVNWIRGAALPSELAAAPSRS
ncbi:MAG: NAD-dependent epimerase/dehydratase family protein [Myxococcota bacterium]